MKQFLDEEILVTQIRICCHVPPGGGAPIHRNRAAHGVVFYTKGQDVYRFEGGREITVREGELLYLPKGSSYTVEGDGTCACYAINFDISKQEGFPPFALKPRGGRELGEAFRAAASLWREKGIGYTLRAMELLYRILARVKEERHAAYVTQGRAERIAPALRIIHASYTGQTPSIAALAALCGMSPEYFRAIFRQCHGESPLRYLNALRLAHARELIESGVCSVTEAALRSGFQDACYFSREFKKHFGISAAVCKR